MALIDQVSSQGIRPYPGHPLSWLDDTHTWSEGDKRRFSGAPALKSLTVRTLHPEVRDFFTRTDSAVLVALRPTTLPTCIGLFPNIEVKITPPTVGTGAMRAGAILIFYCGGCYLH